MNEQRVPLDLHMPKDVYDSLMRQGITQEEIAQQAVQLLSVYCFEQGKLALNQAAEMAGMDRQRFIDLLGSQQVHLRRSRRGGVCTGDGHGR